MFVNLYTQSSQNVSHHSLKHIYQIRAVWGVLFRIVSSEYLAQTSKVEGGSGLQSPSCRLLLGSYGDWQKPFTFSPDGRTAQSIKVPPIVPLTGLYFPRVTCSSQLLRWSVCPKFSDAEANMHRSIEVLHLRSE